MSDSSLTTSQWLTRAAKQLTAANIGTARLDCLILLEDSTGKDRSYLLAHPEMGLSAKQIEQLDTMLTRRSRHEPLAYIRGKTAFYGRTFMVNHHVLEPRPETETMIELLKTLELPQDTVIADIGTGSGAIAITAQLELHNVSFIAVDIDPQCLAVARKNAQQLEATITFQESDLLSTIATNPDVILANLPYVPDTYHINEAAMEEPRLAIFGGPDGLDLYRKMFDQISALSSQPRYILTESLPFQHHGLATIARKHSYIQDQKSDFIQVFTLA
jgi:release factor glutamine methyltransferase